MDPPLVIPHLHEAAEDADAVVDMDDIIPYVEGIQVVQGQLLGLFHAPADPDAVETVEDFMVAVAADPLLLVDESVVDVPARNELGKRDAVLQEELESSFMYEDTPDQEKATAAVKKDMEDDCPMDRLICGDVGFGKTEIAVRAAFKAATDGKQVCLLVPTTILALQHFTTFRSHSLRPSVWVYNN